MSADECQVGPNFVLWNNHPQHACTSAPTRARLVNVNTVKERAGSVDCIVSCWLFSRFWPLNSNIPASEAWIWLSTGMKPTQNSRLPVTSKQFSIGKKYNHNFCAIGFFR